MNSKFNGDEYLDDTFDDMDFEDEAATDSGLEEQSEDRLSFEDNQFSEAKETTNLDVQTAEQYIDPQRVIQQQLLNKRGSKTKLGKTPKQPKAPKQKKEKAPKASKSAKKMKQKGEKAPRDPKAAQKLIKIIALVAIVLCVGVVAIKLNAPKNADLHLIIADNQVNQQQKPVESASTDITDNSNTNDSSEDDDNTSKIQTVDLALKDKYDIEFKVNTKLESDAEYTDHDAKITISYDNVVIGFDEVKKYVDKYNENGVNIVNIGDKKTFEKNSANAEMVMYELTVSVPKDFPTNDVDHGYTGIKPKFTFDVEGTEDKNTLITKRFEFATPKFTSISDNTDTITVGNEYKLRYIAAMPKGLTKEHYKIKFKYSDKMSLTELNINLGGVDIPEESDKK